MANDNNNENVRSLPLDSSDVLRHGIEAFREYVDHLQPKPPDPRLAELELLDRIVMTLLSFQALPQQAIDSALTVIRARRALASESNR
jgi:hypothetical protein